MSKARQQSLACAIRRGNAVIVHDKVTNSLSEVYKKGSTRQQWAYTQKNRVSEEPQIEKRQFKPRHLWKKDKHPALFK